MTYEFKVGDKGKTRNGRDYEVIAVDERLGAFPVISIIKNEAGDHVVSSHNLEGEYSGACSHGLDLIPPPRKLTLYVNMYEGTYYGYPSESSARDCAGHGALKIAHKVEFEIEGGAP